MKNILWGNEEEELLDPKSMFQMENLASPAVNVGTVDISGKGRSEG